MAIKRRVFLTALAGVSSHLLMPLAFAEGGSTPQFLYSAYKDASARYGVCRVNMDTGQIDQVSIPFRGHGCYPSRVANQMIVIGRRPSRSLAVVDFMRNSVSELRANEGRHFYGHAVFNDDKTRLYTTENNYHTGEGVIGVRDASTLDFIDEFPSAGIGPHDIRRLANSDVLVVANGGIKTHPDYGRRILNDGDIEASLAYIDSSSGQVLDVVTVKDKRLSIRHIDINTQNGVVVAMQSHHQPLGSQSLLAYKPKGGELTMLNADVELSHKMRGYIGDCRFLTDDKVVTTSSRGDCLALWELSKNKLSKVLEVAGCSGIATYKQNELLLTVKNTVAMTAANSALSVDALYDVASVEFDNHCFFG